MIGKLPLHVDIADVARTGWPVTQGLPFAEGALPVGAAVRVVDPSGRALPTQSTPLATWRADRQHVKWLLVDFQVHDADQPAGPYTLEYGPDIEPIAPDAPVTVENARDTVRLATGPLALTLARRPALFAGLSVDGIERLADVQPTLVMRDQDGVEYSSAWSPLQAMIEIEDAGPLRASVKVSGWHADRRGRLFCPFELRIHVFAGRRDVRLHHTYIFDQDPQQVSLRAIELRWPLPHGAQRGSVGGDRGQAHAATLGELRWLQTAHDQYTVRDGDQLCAQGQRTLGWIAAHEPQQAETSNTPRTSGGRGTSGGEPSGGKASGGGGETSGGGGGGGVLAVVREAWQQYPKGFRLSADELVIELWPDGAAPLSYDNPYKLPPLRFPGRAALDEGTFVRCLAEQPDAPLNLKSIGCATLGDVEHVIDMVQRHAPDRAHAFSDTDIANAWGTAKTHECWLHFAAEPLTDADCDAFAAAAQQPVLAWPDPAYVSATGAARIMHPRDTQRFADAEHHLAMIFDKLVREPRDRCAIYGMLDYGELINGHNTDDPLVYRSFLRDPDRWPNILDRLGMFNNESQDVINQLWTYYLRTGDREIFTCAEAKTRHTVDVDWTHTHPSHGHASVNPNTPTRCVGLMHYHSALHWSGPWLPSHSLISGLMRHYYLTGDRRTLDVALHTADHHVRNATPNGLVRGHGINREVTGQVQNLLEAYQATWDARYELIIRKTLHMLHAIRNDTGNLPADINTGCGPHGDEVTARGLGNRVSYPGGMLCYVLTDAWALFREPWLRDWIEQLALARVHGMRCDEYTPQTQLVPGATDGGFGVHQVADGWYWHSYCDYSNYHFDVLVAAAWRMTGREDFLAYLHHRLEVFPAPARDAWRCFSGHAFNVINHLGDAIPAMMACVAEADDATLARAGAAWRAQRAADGWPVYDGPREGYDDEGQGPGERTTVRLKPTSGAGRSGVVSVFPVPTDTA